ncbi:suppressor of forked protein suf [Babesia caballi]|uniref:Suppressor of forked protein suf n=1 Tax=Babesia caballi TaxID=5871 RepID=A0AAV4M1R0_BABCB|nr:suppressor of forked protein suf [Babesia caballi]
MAEQGKQQPTQVVTANKLLPSILHGSTPLLPAALSGPKLKEEPGKLYLLEAIDEDALWYNYIKESKDGEVLEEACGVFPNYWKVHHRLALFHLFHKRTRKAFDVYTKAVADMDDYNLHVCYLKFLYHMASIHEYIAALFVAIDKVGKDLRSDPLWKELITVLVKIYNCNLIERNVHTGLLPNLFPSEPMIPSAGGPLYPSEAEQMVFRGVNTLDKKEQTYVAMYSDVNHVRKMFQRWLRTPTNNLKHAWDGYSVFENIASAANVLCAKLLAEAKAVYEVSLEVFDKLSAMYRKVLPAKPAGKRQLSAEQQVERTRVVGCWVDLITYEEKNPLNLPPAEAADRVAFTFRSALMPHVFSPLLWYMYFQFLVANDQREKDKLQFVLAAYLDDAGEVEQAAHEFRKFIDPGLKLIEESEPEREGGQLRQILQACEDGSAKGIKPMKLIHYLNHVRRNQGRQKWREDLHLILSRRELLSWELCWYAADTEVRCFKDVGAAAEVLNEAQHGMAFDMHYTLLHLKYLLNMGRVVDARVLLTDLVVGASVIGEGKSKLAAGDKAALWRFWLHMEYFYGSKAHFAQAKTLYVKDKIANEVGLDTFAEKSKVATESSVRQVFGDIGATFMKKHMDSTKRTATIDMNALVDLRLRLFCAGMGYDDLDAVFLLDDGRAAPSVDCAGAGVSSVTEADTPVVASNFTRRSAANEPHARPRVPITRPDVTALRPLDPANSGTLESTLLLHGSRRPALPESARALDAVATPPKVLFDFLRVLPTPTHGGAFPKMYGNHDAVDYLLRSLEGANFESVPLPGYEPLPVTQLLHLRNPAAAADGPPLQVSLPKPTERSSGQTSLEIAVKEGIFDLNNGLFSVLRFVEVGCVAPGTCHLAQDLTGAGAGASGGSKVKRESKKQKIAI